MQRKYLINGTLDFAVIGKTTNSKKIELIFDNKKVAEIPDEIFLLKMLQYMIVLGKKQNYLKN